jgi:hypothetical protein
MKKIIFYFDTGVQSILVRKKNAEGEEKTVLSSRHNFVAPNEIIARTIDVKTEDEDITSKIDQGYSFHVLHDYFNFESGNGVYFDENIKAYKSSVYGFVILKDNKLLILSPLVISQDKIKAYYYMYPSKFGDYPSLKDIEELLHTEKIITVVNKDRYEKQIASLNRETPRLAKVLVAEGKEPVEGYEEYFEPLLDIEKKVGKLLSDGRIDFKETGSIIQVQKHQEILKKIPGVKPQAGYDIYGEQIPATIRDTNGLKKGEGLVASTFDQSIYIADLDGCLKVVRNRVSIFPVAVIHGDVGLDTGNISFNGTVHVTGSVKPGFKVQADSDVIVDEEVEEAFITAGGDITVKSGVLGKETGKLVAGGDISARFLQHSKIEANGNVIVEDSIINCDVLCYKSIKVTGKNAKIIGGRITALYEVSSAIIGTQNETTTNVTVGRNFIVEKELADKRAEMKLVRDRIDEITTNLKMQFGEEIFLKPKEYIAILPPPKKKASLALLNDLGTANASLRKLAEEAKGIEERLKFDKEPVIIATGRVYPGVVLNIKKSVRKIERAVDNAKFFEDSMDKTVKFVAAI